MERMAEPVQQAGGQLCQDRQQVHRLTAFSDYQRRRQHVCCRTQGRRQNAEDHSEGHQRESN